VQLVEHDFVPRPAFPVRVAPVEGERVDYGARAMDVVRIPARGGIRDGLATIDDEAVTIAGTRAWLLELEPARRGWRGGEIPRGAAVVVQAHCDLSRGRCPQAKTRTARGQELAAERH